MGTNLGTTVLTIYTNLLGEILRINIKLKKILRGCRTTRYKEYPNPLSRLKRLQKLHPLKSQLVYSLRFPKWNDANHLIFQPELQVFLK